MASTAAAGGATGGDGDAMPPARRRRRSPRSPSSSTVPDGLAAEPVLLRARQPQHRLDRAPFVTLYSIAAMQAANVSILGGKSQLPFNLPPSTGFAVVGALHLLLWLACNWSTRVAAVVGFSRARSVSDATHVLASVASPGAGVISGKGGANGKGAPGTAHIVPLEVRPARGGGAPVPGFDVARTRYAWDLWGDDGGRDASDDGDGGRDGSDDGDGDEDRRPRHTPRFARLRYPDSLPFADYAAGSLSRGVSDAAAASLLEAFGPNACPVPVPAFKELLKEQLVAPFFVFQVFCVGLWTLDEYWAYSLFTLLMLVGFESTVVGQRLRNLTELRGLQAPKPRVRVFRSGKWADLPGEALVPGDLISVGGEDAKKKEGTSPSGDGGEGVEVPADCLLLAGRAVVEEAALTGESAPQWKAPVYESSASVAASAGEDGPSVGGLEEATAGEDEGRGERHDEIVRGAVFNVPGDPRTTRLDLARHKHHVLFSGTKILQHASDPGASVGGESTGCLCVVLRTGFEAAQGRMVRTILSTAGRVTAASSWEAGAFILLLLVFAVAAAAHVLRVGLADPSRDRFKLYLNCVMIVTSVVPPELPMELTIAVNASLLALARRGVFCTEPFRIPVAGGVSTACFDKTGTLTSDEMVLEGVCPAAAVEAGAEAAVEAASSALVDASRAPTAAQLVLAACHSLAPTAPRGDASSNPVALAGDPLERAAFSAVRWAMAPGGDGGRVTRPGQASSSSSASPFGCQRVSSTVLRRYHFSASLRRMSVVLAVEGAPREDEAAFFERGGAASTSRVDVSTASSPALVVATKGAPEAVRPLLASVPPGYDAAAAAFAARGGRVLALAARLLTAKGKGDGDAPATTPSRARALPRPDAESSLTFVGFAVLGCPLRPESAPALKELRESGHDLVMITGDAPLTACHVARELGILPRDPPDRKTLVLQRAPSAPEAIAGVVEGEHGAGVDPDSFFEWSVAGGGGAVPSSPSGDGGAKDKGAARPRPAALPYVRPGLPGDAASLSLSCDLCVTGDGLAHAIAASSASSSSSTASPAQQLIAVTRVFARVSPDQKEAILDSLRLSGATTLMCGDGTNDVGALKAAHVGVALLPPRTLERMQQQAVEAHRRRLEGQATGGATQRGRAAAPAAAAPDQHRLAGQKMLDELRASGRPVDARAERMASWLDALDKASGGSDGTPPDDGQPPLVRPGDASAAAPFTAKAGAALACADVVRQGRAALVTTVQMFKILGLLSLSSAYALSVMYLAGVKLSDGQATAQGVLSAALFFMISQAAPSPKLSKRRPHASVFTRYAMVSLVLQAASHVALLAWAHSRADALMVSGAAEAATVAAREAAAEAAAVVRAAAAGEETAALSEAAEAILNATVSSAAGGANSTVALLLEAARNASSSNSTAVAGAAAAAASAFDVAGSLESVSMSATQYLKLARSPDGAFAPNLVNTVAYLVNSALMVTTFGANYVGEPFCTPLSPRSALGKTLSYGGLGIAALLLGLIPGANRALSLVRVPPLYAMALVFLCAANAAWCVGVERAARAAFPARSRALLPPTEGGGEGDDGAPTRKSGSDKKDD